MELRPYQIEAKNAVISEWNKGNKKTLLVLPTGCHAKGQKLLMADGRTRTVEDITINDKLLGSDGTVRNILYLHHGYGKLYEVRPLYGNPFIVTEDHKLTLLSPRNKYVDITVADWLVADKKSEYKLVKASAIEKFPNSAPLSPYSKIPYAYKTASLKVRQKLLGDLFDTAGTVKWGKCICTVKSEVLAKDIAFVCNSCGLLAYTIKNKIYISGDFTDIPCRRLVLPPKSETSLNFTVKKSGVGEYYGFTVDGDNRYLLDDFTVTHNCGKTIIFNSIAAEEAEKGNRVLILAHRSELLSQAADKLKKATGMDCALEKAESSSLGSNLPITVGSIQSLAQDKRLAQFSSDYFQSIIIDEAHHCMSDTYKKVLGHFPEANVLGVTATPDRGDMKNLANYFDSKAYEYTMREAVKEGYLCPIKAQMIPLKIDIKDVGVTKGDFKSGEMGSALTPYLHEIAIKVKKYARGRKTVIFLPLIQTSLALTEELCNAGLRAKEINGKSSDRTEILADFEKGKYDVLCNSMLLTEGWDCPSVDCIAVLRPTRSPALYKQMVGRGMRLAEGKEGLLLLDFLWLTEKYDLCRPSSLIAANENIAKRLNKKIEENGIVDLLEAEDEAKRDIKAEKEEALRQELERMRNRKSRLVDPFEFALKHNGDEFINYEETFRWEKDKPTEKQIAFIKRKKIDTSKIKSKGQASALINVIIDSEGRRMATPKQISCLKRFGFNNVSSWSFDKANYFISIIAEHDWKVPKGLK